MADTDVFSQPVAVPSLQRDAFEAKTADLYPTSTSTRFIALPHKYTGARVGSMIDRGDTEYKEAIREIVMREEGRRRKADAGDSGCFGEKRGPERES